MIFDRYRQRRAQERKDLAADRRRWENLLASFDGVMDEGTRTAERLREKLGKRTS